MTTHLRNAPVVAAPALSRLGRHRWSRLHKVAFFTALLGTLLFFLPVLGAFKPGSSGWPGYLSGSDTQIFYFPAFMEGYSRFWHGGMAGIDFGTNGGASVFALRANMLPYYPFYILAYLIFNVSDYTQAAVAYTLIQATHLFACLYFCVLLGRRFLGLTRPASVFFASLYSLSFLSSMYFSFATFYFQMALVPVLAYAFCRLLFARNIIEPVLVSALVLNEMLSNYAPTMAASLIVAMIVCVYVWYARVLPRVSRAHWRLMPIIFSISIAAVVVAPYYIGQIDYFKKSVTTSRALIEVAHSLAFSGRDLFSAFSQSIKVGMTPTEGRLLWGLVPLSIWLVGLGVLVAYPERISLRVRRLIGFGLAIYLGVLSITMGTSLLMSDVFYYGVPVFGTMHAYQRFLLFAQIFFAAAVASLASVCVTYLSQKARTAGFAICTTIWIVVTILVSLGPNSIDTFVSREMFLVEMLLLQIAVTLFCLGRSQKILLPVSLLCAVLGVRPMYDVQIIFGTEEAGRKIMPHTAVADARLADFINANSDKTLKKMLSVYDGFAPYLPRNHPWQITDRVRVINFAGYEPHLSRVREYTALMGGNFGDYDRNWVLRTGTDFISWTKADEARVAALTRDTVSLGPVLQLSSDVSVAKLIYDQPLMIGQSMAILSLSEAKQALWPAPLAIDGWEIRNGWFVKVPGTTNHVGFAVRQSAGRIYEVVLDVSGSTQGSISIALGGSRGEPLLGTQTGRFARAFVSDGINDLWITATPDFNGSIGNVLVRDQETDRIAEAKVQFDNGLVRLEGPTGQAEVVGFQTDWSQQIRVAVSARAPTRLVYMLWPISYMVPYLDGKRVDWHRGRNDPAYLELSAGDHIFELRFKSLPLKLFSWFLWLYATAVLATLVVWILRRKSVRGMWNSWRADVPSE